MLQTIIGVILLITYLVFIVYAARGGNLLLGVFVMSVLWSLLGFIGGEINWQTINATIFDGGPTAFGPTAVYIIFGSWFGQVLIATGIAGTIIRKSVELGGDKPSLTCILMCIVTALIFTTSYGPGAVVAIGVIVFPIMLSLGIPKPLAAGSFVMSVGCGLYFNQSLLTQAAGTMVVDGEQYQIGPEWYSFAGVAFAIHLLSIIIMIIVSNTAGGKRKRVHAWAAPTASDPAAKNVGILGCLTVILPVTLSITLKINQVPAICISVIWALIFTGNMKGWNKIAKLVQKSFYDGVADVGLVLAFLMFLQMFARAASSCRNLLAPIISPILPNSTFLLFLVFGLLGFLALYRGPLTIWGAGTATFAIVAAATDLPLSILYPLFYIPCCTVNTNVCPTQSWNVWAIGYTHVSIKEFMWQVLPYALPCAFVLEMVAYFMFAA